jgi:hypothetical protein
MARTHVRFASRIVPPTKSPAGGGRVHLSKPDVAAARLSACSAPPRSGQRRRFDEYEGPP